MRKGERHTHCKRGHEFTPDNLSWTRRKDGTPQHQCRICKKQKDREYYLLNVEKIKVRSTVYAAINADRVRSAARLRAERNRGSHNARMAEVRQDPQWKARNREYQKTYRQRHAQAISQRRRDKWDRDPEYKQRQLEIGRTYYAKHRDRYRAYWKSRRKDPEYVKVEVAYKEKMREHIKEYHARHFQQFKKLHPDKFRQQWKEANRKNIERLSTNYIAGLLAHGRIKRSDVKRFPELLETKREQIKLHRLVKSIKTNHNEAHQ